MNLMLAILNYGRLDASCRLARELNRHGLPTRVVSSPHASDPPPMELRSEYRELTIDQKLGRTDWYGGKFVRATRAAIEEGCDVIGWMACDCRVPCPASLVRRTRRAFETLPQLGVYMPGCWWTHWFCDKKQAPVIDSSLQLYETPMIDSTCWFARQDIAAVLAAPEHEVVPNYGWGIDHASTWVAHSLGYRWGRDYGILLGHKQSTSYDSLAARIAQRDYQASFGSDAATWLAEKWELAVRCANALQRRPAKRTS